MTPHEAELLDTLLVSDPQLVFHISLADVMRTIMCASDRQHSDQEQQEIMDWIIQNRSMIRDAILDAFDDFGETDHSWSDAVQLAVEEVKDDEKELAGSHDHLDHDTDGCAECVEIANLAIEQETVSDKH
jgi:hypothetical protein